MSSENLWLISHSRGVKANDRANHRKLTQKITKLLKEHRVNPTEIADELGIPISRAKNWYFRRTTITALDLLRLAIRFAIVREYVMAAIEPTRIRGSGR
jgi:hypothetical protein